MLILGDERVELAGSYERLVPFKIWHSRNSNVRWFVRPRRAVRWLHSISHLLISLSSFRSIFVFFSFFFLSSIRQWNRVWMSSISFMFTFCIYNSFSFCFFWLFQIEFAVERRIISLYWWRPFVRFSRPWVDARNLIFAVFVGSFNFNSFFSHFWLRGEQRANKFA